VKGGFQILLECIGQVLIIVLHLGMTLLDVHCSDIETQLRQNRIEKDGNNTPYCP